MSLGTNQRGFTLIELLVVIAIIVILASFAIPNINNALSSAKQTADISNARQLGTILFTIANDNNGVYPGSANDPVTDRASVSSTTLLFQSMLRNGELNDPRVLISKSGGNTPYTGSLNKANLTAANIGWDYVTNLTTASNGQLPLIVTRGAVNGGSNVTVFTKAVEPGNNNLWGKQGFVIYTVGNSAAFLKTRNSSNGKVVPALLNAEDLHNSANNIVITVQ